MSSAPRDITQEDAEELYEHAPCGYLTASPEGRIVRVNETLVSWTRQPREQLLQKKFSELLTVGGRIFYETHVAPLLQMQGAVEEIALDVARPGESPLPVLVNAVVKLDAAGKPLCIRITLFNVTDRRRYEKELVAARKAAEAAAQAKSDFVSMISHEIRTPLTAIIGVAHLLRKTDLSAQQEKLTKVLRSSADNLLTLVNDILDFSKIEAGKVSLEQRPIELRAAVEEVVSALRVKAEERGNELVARIDGRVPPVVLGDPVKIRQILANLIGNAIKFTSKGSVTVSLDLQDDGPPFHVRFEVRDTGIGIARDRLAHIFDDFTQASYDISVKYGGTGLGLAITRRLVEMHGSSITVESAPNEGSCFRFVLAFDVGEAERPSQPVDDELLARVRGKRVLLADDNEVNHFVIGGFLSKWGVVYDAAHDGRQALELAATNEYDLVLMDLRMPVLDGYDAARGIRRLEGERFRTMPIIAVSASMRMGDQTTLAPAGFSDFIGKPVAPDLLLAKLAHHLGRERSPEGSGGG